MRALLPLLLSVAALSASASACAAGCLRCDASSDACLLCDFVSGFAPTASGGCAAKASDKCQLLGPAGECLRCASAYYYDDVSDACLPVPAANLVPHCDAYASIYGCARCADGFYLDAEVCLPVSFLIDGCTAYVGAALCGECAPGSVLHPSGSRCVAADPSCLFAGNLDCAQCAPGYALDANYFVGGLFAGNMPADAATDAVADAAGGRSYTALATPCRPLTIPGCDIYADFYTCRVCADGYYLSADAHSCVEYPRPALPHCVRYSYYNSCAECAQGYLLASSSECQPVKPIANCAAYSPTSAANVCIQCADGFFVNGNTCNARAVAVPHCATYSAERDNCASCATGFTLTSDSRGCLTSIAHCDTYAASSASTSALACVRCADTYVYRSTTATCEQGTVANCLQYQRDAPASCQTCAPAFYLSAGACQPHAAVARCSTYSALVANACTACDNTSFLTTLTLGCAPISTSIDACVEYASPTACKTCAPRYYLNASARCTAIGSAEHCLAKSVGGQCTQCESGYLLVGGACSLPLDIQTRFCEQMQGDGVASTYECARCAKNAVPFDYAGTFVCRASSSLGSAAVPNCVKYSSAGGVTTCVGCASGLIVSDSNTCVSSSSSATTKSLQLNFAKTRATLSSGLFRVDLSLDYYGDVAAPLQSCAVLVYSNTHTQRCLRCKPGYIASVNVGNDKSHISPTASDPASFVPQLGFGYNTYSCASVPSPTYYPGASSSVPSGCASFVVVGSSVYCKACARGLTGRVDTISGQSFQYCDTAIADCNTGVTYGGLVFEYGSGGARTDLLLYLSCHACFSPRKLPVVFGTSTGDIAPFGLALSYNTPVAESVRTSLSVQCLEPTAAALRLLPEQSLGTPIANCGVLKYNVDAPKLSATYDSYASTPLLCAACRPGFAPVRAGPDSLIVRCDPIANCDTSSSAQWLNGCAQCALGHAWYYDTSSYTIDFSRCVPSADTRCLATAQPGTVLSQVQSSLPSGACAMCRPGHSFNADGFCEVIDAPLCAPGAFAKSSYVYRAAAQNVDMLNLMNAGGNGCQACTSGYAAVSNASSLLACTPSPYVLQADFPDLSVFVPQCKQYGSLGGVLMCAACTEGHLPSVDGRLCVPADVFPDCERVAADGSACALCQSGYVLVGGYCEKPAVLQCDSYDAGLLFQSCLSCIDGYKLVNNKCVAGHVPHCRHYANNETCVSCDDAYLLVALAAGRQACLRINEELNCAQVSTTPLNTSQRLQCAQCNAGFAPLAPSAPQFVCQRIAAVENCELYDAQDTPSLASFDCVRCKPQFFLRNGACVARLVTTTNCAAYSPVDDFCASCADGFYLSNERACVAFPAGIFGCVAYSGAAACSGCDRHMYLSGASCNYVTAPIAHCAYYRDNSSCAQCDFNFVLSGTACVRASALNCRTYARADRCATCPPGFGLQPSGEGVDCVFVASANCRDANPVFPFNCRECSPLFYNDSGRCLAVESAVDNCDVYASPVACARCLPSFVRSLDGKYCLSADEAGVQPLAQCVDNRLTLRPQCHACGAGMRFVQGVCTQCTAFSRASGCLFCNDTDSACLLCAPTYYMDKSGRCLPNSAAPSALVGDVWSR